MTAQSRTTLKAWQKAGYQDKAGDMDDLIDSMAHITEEAATDAQAITGTATNKFITPANLEAKLTNDLTLWGATLTPGASDTGTCTIQLTDKAGDDLAVRASVFAYLSDDANGDSIAATAPSGGIAIGTDGLLIPVVANKAFHLISEADGDIDVALTEAGAATWYLVLVLPDGSLIASGAIAFTA